VRSFIPLFVTAALAAGCAAHGTPRRPSPSATPSGITEASVRGHLEFLASDALNGRGSGTRDEWLAATYIGSQLRSWGVEPLGDDGGFVEDVQIERREVTSPPILAFQGRQYSHGKEITVSRLGGARLSGPLQKYRKGAPVEKGAVLLLPDTDQPAAADTVAATIVMESQDAVQARTRRPPGPPRAVTIQHIVGVPQRAAVTLNKDSYAALAAAADGIAVTLTAEARPPTIAHTWNAMGRLTGSTPADAGAVILLTAHLDHLGNSAGANATPGADTINNGADDDASGSVAVLELAEALAMGPRPKRTIIFAWFGSEERGGFGAEHFIDAPPVPLETIVTNLEFEMIGRADKAVPAHTLWLTGYERSTLGPALATQGAKIVADPHPDQRFFMRSDNIQLARRGVIAQTVSSFGLHTDYHRPSDEVKTIDFAHMTDSIRSLLAPVLWLANSGFRPAWLPGMKP
jgi:peptidase M28-like protein